MTDKQIIIDGVDVSGCTYSKIGIDKKCYCEQDLYDDGTPVFTCDECTNCYYKQFKRTESELVRKEQECEELKEKMEKYCYDCDVAERMRKVIYAATGGRLSYANYTVEAIEQAYNDQLCIDVEYRTKEIKEELNQLKAELEQEKALKETYLACYKTKHEDIEGEFFKYKQTLTEIKEIAKPQTHYIDINQNKTAMELEYDYANIVWNLEQRMYKILQKISEVMDDE